MKYLKKGFIHMKINYYDATMIRYKEKADEILTELPEFVKAFIDDCRGKNRSERTILGYVTDIKTFFTVLLQENPSLNGDIKNITLDVIGSLTYKDLNEFILDIKSYSVNGEKRMNKEYAKNRKVATIRSLFKYLYANRDIPDNPASILKGPTIHDKEPVVLDVEESNDILSSIKNQTGHSSSRQAKRCEKTKYRDLAIVTLLLGTGIRVSELVGINLKDFNWKKNGVRVTRKGGNEQTVYFNEDVKKAIYDYIQHERKSPDDDPDALFVSSQNRQRLSVRSVERMIKKYAQTNVPDKKITPHRLRASYGTNLLAATGDINLVADALGHSNLASVKKYIHKAEENRLKARESVTWTKNNTESK